MWSNGANHEALGQEVKAWFCSLSPEERARCTVISQKSVVDVILELFQYLHSEHSFAFSWNKNAQLEHTSLTPKINSVQETTSQSTRSSFRNGRNQLDANCCLYEGCFTQVTVSSEIENVDVETADRSASSIFQAEVAAGSQLNSNTGSFTFDSRRMLVPSLPPQVWGAAYANADPDEFRQCSLQLVHALCLFTLPRCARKMSAVPPATNGTDFRDIFSHEYAIYVEPTVLAQPLTFLRWLEVLSLGACFSRSCFPKTLAEGNCAGEKSKRSKTSKSKEGGMLWIWCLPEWFCFLPFFNVAMWLAQRLELEIWRTFWMERHMQHSLASDADSIIRPVMLCREDDFKKSYAIASCANCAICAFVQANSHHRSIDTFSAFVYRELLKRKSITSFFQIFPIEPFTSFINNKLLSSWAEVLELSPGEGTPIVAAKGKEPCPNTDEDAALAHFQILFKELLESHSDTAPPVPKYINVLRKFLTCLYVVPDITSRWNRPVLYSVIFKLRLPLEGSEVREADRKTGSGTVDFGEAASSGRGRSELAKSYELKADAEHEWTTSFLPVQCVARSRRPRSKAKKKKKKQKSVSKQQASTVLQEQITKIENSEDIDFEREVQLRQAGPSCVKESAERPRQKRDRKDSEKVNSQERRGRVGEKRMEGETKHESHHQLNCAHELITRDHSEVDHEKEQIQVHSTQNQKFADSVISCSRGPKNEEARSVSSNVMRSPRKTHHAVEYLAIQSDVSTVSRSWRSQGNSLSAAKKSSQQTSQSIAALDLMKAQVVPFREQKVQFSSPHHRFGRNLMDIRSVFSQCSGQRSISFDKRASRPASSTGVAFALDDAVVIVGRAHKSQQSSLKRFRNNITHGRSATLTTRRLSHSYGTVGALNLSGNRKQQQQRDKCSYAQDWPPLRPKRQPKPHDRGRRSRGEKDTTCISKVTHSNHADSAANICPKSSQQSVGYTSGIRTPPCSCSSTASACSYRSRSPPPDLSHALSHGGGTPTTVCNSKRTVYHKRSASDHDSRLRKVDQQDTTLEAPRRKSVSSFAALNSEAHHPGPSGELRVGSDCEKQDDVRSRASSPGCNCGSFGRSVAAAAAAAREPWPITPPPLMPAQVGRSTSLLSRGLRDGRPILKYQSGELHQGFDLYSGDPACVSKTHLYVDIQQSSATPSFPSPPISFSRESQGGWEEDLSYSRPRSISTTSEVYPAPLPARCFSEGSQPRRGFSRPRRHSYSSCSQEANQSRTFPSSSCATGLSSPTGCSSPAGTNAFTRTPPPFSHFSCRRMLTTDFGRFASLQERDNYYATSPPSEGMIMLYSEPTTPKHGADYDPQLLDGGAAHAVSLHSLPRWATSSHLSSSPVSMMLDDANTVLTRSASDAFIGTKSSMDHDTSQGFHGSDISCRGNGCTSSSGVDSSNQTTTTPNDGCNSKIDISPPQSTQPRSNSTQRALVSPLHPEVLDGRARALSTDLAATTYPATPLQHVSSPDKHAAHHGGYFHPGMLPGRHWPSRVVSAMALETDAHRFLRQHRSRHDGAQSWQQQQQRQPPLYGRDGGPSISHEAPYSLGGYSLTSANTTGSRSAYAAAAAGLLSSCQDSRPAGHSTSPSSQLEQLEQERLAFSRPKSVTTVSHRPDKASRMKTARAPSKASAVAPWLSQSLLITSPSFRRAGTSKTSHNNTETSCSSGSSACSSNSSRCRTRSKSKGSEDNVYENYGAADLSSEPMRQKKGSPSHFSHLHQEILQFAEYTTSLSHARHLAVLQVLMEVRQTVTKLWRDGRVKIYGSFATGLWLPSSDLDLVILGVDSIKNRADLRTALHWLAAALVRETGKAAISSSFAAGTAGRAALSGSQQQLPRQRPPVRRWLHSMKVIDSAKIPVLKLVADVGGAQLLVDISFDASSEPHGGRSKFHNGLLSVHLIQHYLSTLPALRPLALVLKQFLYEKW